jgi:hypothetical protein
MVKIGGILFAANLIFGLYFLNLGFNFIALPTFLASITNWINIIGGALLIVGGIFAMQATSPMRRRY